MNQKPLPHKIPLEANPLIGTLKHFISTFDIDHPSWSHLPTDFPNCDLDGLTGDQVGHYNSILTLWQLQHPKTQTTTSRAWQDPNGYQYLAVWQNAALLRILIRKFTLTLPLTEKRLKAQMDDAARSVKRNIEEGWKRATTSEYLQFLGYSQGSLEELKGDIHDATTDGFLPSHTCSSLANIGINLGITKGPAKGNIKGEPTDPNHPYAQPLATLNPRTLSCQIFMELINKTDWLLRQTVTSLETKLNQDQKHYQVQKLRYQTRFGWSRK